MRIVRLGEPTCRGPSLRVLGGCSQNFRGRRRNQPVLTENRSPKVDRAGFAEAMEYFATANALACLPLPADDRSRAIRALQAALRHEPTVAERSTMTAALDD